MVSASPACGSRSGPDRGRNGSDLVDIHHLAVFDLDIALKAPEQRRGGIDRSQARDGALDRGAADMHRAEFRVAALDRGRDDIVDLAGLDQVDDIGRRLVHVADRIGRDHGG